MSALPVPGQQGNLCLGGGSGTVVPLLTGAASAPARPSHTGAGDAPREAVYVHGVYKLRTVPKCMLCVFLLR